jgi:predicted small lipoprotein YifL
MVTKLRSPYRDKVTENQQNNTRRMIMKKLFLLLMTLSVLFVIAACGSKDTEYYMSHPDELKTKLEECKQLSAAEMMADRECAAVGNAMSKKFSGDKMERPLQGKPQGRPTKQF